MNKCNCGQPLDNDACPMRWPDYYYNRICGNCGVRFGEHKGGRPHEYPPKGCYAFREKTMVMDEAQLRGKLYELGTVDIRSVLRLLNKQKKIVAGTELAAMRHEAAFRLITSNFNGEEVEAAYLAVTTKTPEIAAITDEQAAASFGGGPATTALPEPAPKTRAQILEELLKGGELDADKVRTIAKDVLHEPLVELQTRVSGLDRSLKETLDYTNRALGDHDAKLQGLTSDLNGSIKSLREEVQQQLTKSQVTNLVITFPDDSTKDIGITHKLTPKLIKYLSTGVACYLPGPAGSGKSTAAEQAAKALGIKFYPLSFSSQTTETKLLGYMDAAGNYHGTQFREAYEYGGLVLFDEIDAGNPNVIAVLNAALSGVWCSFADKVITRHKDFRCVAAANTWGTGRTIQYVGRNALDAATLNRFVFIEWDYDEALETAVAGLPEWSSYVQECRAEVRRRGINYLITPRASIYGAQLLRAGCKVNDVVNDVLFPNLDPDNRRTMPPAPVISV